MNFFAKLGFHWDRSAVPNLVPTHSIDRVAFRFHRMLSEFVWDASVLEGIPLTFPEVQTLLGGVTVGGQKISDQEKVLNLAKGSNYLFSLVKADKFSMEKVIFTELHSIVARNEGFKLGNFQSDGKEKNGTPDLDRIFVSGLHMLKNEVQFPLERAFAFFMFGALQKFFFAGNRRASSLMMNGILMSAGIDAISIPAAKAQQFNENMVRFCLDKDATGMMAFLVDCHPDAEQIHKANQSYPVERDTNG